MAFAFGILKADAYEDEMRMAITSLENIEANAEHFLALASRFEVLSETKSQDWLPVYYAALSYTWSAFVTADVSSIDATLDVATMLLKECRQLNGDESELLCVQSMVASARIMVNPAARGMQYGMKSSELIQTAISINQDNPRCYLIQAQGLMFTPESFGGGCKGAGPFIDNSLNKYAVYKPQSDLSPNWGLGEAQALKKKCD